MHPSKNKLIKVTQDHINRGELCCSGHCPVALALMSAGFTWVSVGLSNMMFTTKSGAKKCVEPPEKVRNFIILFDQSYHVLPFEFELVY